MRASQTFITTSNWATGVPCFTFTRGSGFPQGQCYSTIQGTSMAAPHVSAAMALAASEHPALRSRPDRLIARVKGMAREAHNLTPPLSATDRSPGDVLTSRCPTGFCHLGGAAIPDRQAYGAGLVSARTP